MKKSLSVLLSVAMSVSIFSSVAFGAEGNLDTKAKYDALVQSGIFDGMEDGLPHLEDPMTRAQLAKILTRLKNLQEVSGSSYTDLDGAGWASGYIEAVTKAGLMDGVDVGIFAPSSNVTLEQLATVLVRALNLPVPANPWVSGEVSDWAKGYVAAALQAGLIAPKSDFTKQAARADLVDSTYSAKQQIDAQNEATATFSVDGAKALKVAFSKAVDTSKVTFTVKYGSADAKPAKVTWSSDKKAATLEYNVKLQPGEYTITAKGAASKDLTGKVSVEEEKVAKIEILSDTAPAVFETNTYKVKAVNVYYKVLNQYGEDVTKTTSVSWQSSVGPLISDDVQRGIVTFEIPDNNYYFQLGTQFTVNGYVAGTGVNVAKTMKIGDAAYANSVEVKGLWSADGKPLTLTSDYGSYYLLLDVKDQYGNPVKAKDLDTKNGQLNVYSSNPMLVNVVDSNYDPHFFDNVGPNNDQLGLQLVKTHDSSQVVYTGDLRATITLTPKRGGTSATYTIELQKGSIVQNFSLSAPTVTVAQGDKVNIPYTATDADGNSITNLDDLRYMVGNTVVNANGVNLTATAGSIYWAKDESTQKAVIKYEAPDNFVGNVYINAYVQSTGKNVQLTISVKDKKYPAAVTDWTIKPALVENAVVRLKGENIKAQDQYGNNMTIDDANFFKDYAFRVRITNNTNSTKIVKTNNVTVQENTYLLTAKGSYIDLKGVSQGTSTLTIDVVDKNGNTVWGESPYTGTRKDYTQASVKDFSLQVVKLKDISKFEIGSVAKVYENRYDVEAGREFDGKARDVDVYGLIGNTKVTLGEGDFKVSSGINGIAINNRTMPDVDQVILDGSGAKVQFATNQDEIKGNIYALIFKENDTIQLSKEITVSRATPVATRIVTNSEIDSATNSYKSNYKDGVLYIKQEYANGVIWNHLVNKFEVRDQYDINQAYFRKTATYTFSQVENGSGTLSVINGTTLKGTDSITVGNGDKFTVSMVTDNGKFLQFRVVVTDNPGQY